MQGTGPSLGNIASFFEGEAAPCINNLKRFRHEGGIAMVLSQLARCQSSDKTLPSPYTVS